MGHRRRQRWLIVASLAVVLMIGGAACAIGIAGLGLNDTIGSDRTAVAVSALLAKDPAVQARIRDEVVSAFVKEVPLLEPFRSTLSGIVAGMLRTPRFQAVVSTAIRRSVAELLDGRASQVSLGLDDVRGPLLEALHGSVLVHLIPPPGTTDRVVVIDAATVQHVRKIRSEAVRASGWLLGIGVFLVAVGVGFARGWRWIAVGVGSASLAVAAIILPGNAGLVHERAVGSVTDPTGRSVAEAAWDVAIASLRHRMGTVAWAAAALALAAFAIAAGIHLWRARHDAMAGTSGGTGSGMANRGSR